MKTGAPNDLFGWAVCRETCTYGSLRGYRCETCPISSGNFFLPIHCGAPDYYKAIQQFHSDTSTSTSTSNFNFNSNLNSYFIYKNNSN